MPRTAQPWFYQQTGWWMCYLHGKKVRLAQGRKNKREARRRLAELQSKALACPALESPNQTVASVIEAYLEYAAADLAASTLANRKPCLQGFADRHG